MDNKVIADLLFPNVTLTEEELFKKYPKRNLEKGQMVTRFAPSPTGLVHIGNFFQAFISFNIAKNTDGVLFLRIEDTDRKREKVEAKKVLYNNVLGDFETKSDIQAKRKDLHEMREKVTKLQSIISEKSEIQQSTSEDIMFGDVVNLENENVKSYADIYSATSKQNGLKSYYGVSEERVVESIFFSKGNERINTYTYEEYQNALNNGYTLEGYTLVNQNSLGEDNLVIEGRYSKDSVKLVRK